MPAQPLSLPAHHVPQLTPAGHCQWLLLRLPLQQLQWRWWPGAESGQLLGLALRTRYRHQDPGLWLYRRWRPGWLTSCWQSPFAMELKAPGGFLRYELAPNEGGAAWPSLPSACYWGQAGQVSFGEAQLSPVQVRRFETDFLPEATLQGAAYLSSLTFERQARRLPLLADRPGWPSLRWAKET